jgi:AdoMet-dependent heme synthase
LQQRIAERKLGIDVGSQHERAVDAIGRAPRGLNDVKGFVFISHKGGVFPSGFLPLAAENVRDQELSTIYRESPLFCDLRDTSRLDGKCGSCGFKDICGGSRARAYALNRKSTRRRTVLLVCSHRLPAAGAKLKSATTLHVLQGA